MIRLADTLIEPRSRRSRRRQLFRAWLFVQSMRAVGAFIGALAAVSLVGIAFGWRLP